MTGTMGHLAAASLVFVLGHVLISSTPLRAVLVARLGAGPFQGLFSLGALAALVWMIAAYTDAPTDILWIPGTGLRHGAAAVMVLVSILVVAGLTTPNPTMVGGARKAAQGPVGINKVTRHPMMWGFALWGIVHIAANGDSASLVFFGAFTVLAVAGTGLIDAKRRAKGGDDWRAFADATSNLPFAAIAAGRARVGLGEIGYGRLAGGVALWAVLLFAHEFVIGVSPLAP